MYKVIVVMLVLILLAACASTQDGQKVSQFKIASQCVRLTDGYPPVYRCIDARANMVIWVGGENGIVVLPMEETNLR